MPTTRDRPGGLARERGAVPWTWTAVAILGVVLVACGVIYVRAETEFAETSGLVGLLSAVAGGAFTLMLQMMQSAQQRRQGHRRQRQHMTAGDRFLELKQFDAALAEFEQARELLPDELLPHRKLVETRCAALAFDAFHEGDGIAYERSGTTPRALTSDDRVEQAQRALYHLQARAPELQNDVPLILLEALTFKVARRHDHAIECLEKARAKEPKNPEVLAELGLQKGMLRGDPESRERGLRLLEQAIELEPTELLYRFYRARTLERMDRTAEAIRAYTELAQLSSDRKTPFAVSAVAKSLYGLMCQAAQRGLLDRPDWDASVDERRAALRWLEQVEVPHTGGDQSLDALFVRIERAAGCYDTAAERVATVLSANRSSWNDRRQWLRDWLQKYLELIALGARPSSRLSPEEARTALEEFAEPESA
ncbi:MAG: hypothetical protein AB7I09_19170 [Planctomycetota bacterium]